MKRYSQEFILHFLYKVYPLGNQMKDGQKFPFVKVPLQRKCYQLTTIKHNKTPPQISKVLK